MIQAFDEQVTPKMCKCLRRGAVRTRARRPAGEIGAAGPPSHFVATRFAGFNSTDGTRNPTAAATVAIASMAQNVRFSECCSAKRRTASPDAEPGGLCTS